MDNKNRVKLKIKFAVCAIAASMSLASAPSVQAGSMAGVATEVTQLANNVELMMQVAESTQQTVQQINMLATMLQNLKSLSNLAGVARAMGINLTSLNNFIRAYNGTRGAINALQNMEAVLTRFGRNADSMASFYESILEDFDRYAKAQGTSSVKISDVYGSLEKLSGDRRQQAQAILKQRMDMLQSMQNDYKYIQDNANEIGSITGNVEGLQFLASQNVNIQRLLLDTNVALQHAATELAAERVRNAEAEEADKRAANIMLRDTFLLHRF